MKAASVNRPGYFFHLDSNPVSSSVFFTRVWINATGDGIGFGAVTSPAVEPSYFATTVNTTYLIVIKYDITSKLSSLYVFSTMPTTEPTTATATFTETATITNVGSVALRQYTFSGSTTNENVIVDGIRVATSWNGLFGTYTDLSTPKAEALSISLAGTTLTVKDVAEGSIVDVYSTLGAKVQSAQLVNGAVQLNNLSKGLYIVRVGNQSSKIMM